MFENFTVRSSSLLNNPTLITRLESELLAIAPPSNSRYINIEKTSAPANTFIKSELGLLSVSWTVQGSITGLYGQVRLSFPATTEVVYSDDPTGVDLVRKVIAARKRLSTKVDTWFLTEFSRIIQGIRDEADAEVDGENSAGTWVSRVKNQYEMARMELMSV